MQQIKDWNFDYKFELKYNSKTIQPSFIKWYFGKFEYTLKVERKNYLKEKDYYFKTFNLDNNRPVYNNEDIIKITYAFKLEEIRLKNKLEKLNCQPGTIHKTVHIGRKNKHGNYIDVYHNGVEIIH